MSSATSYGGWVTDRPAATGDTSNPVRLVGWVAAAGTALTMIGTGGHLSLEHIQRGAQQAFYGAPAFEVAEVDNVRTPAELGPDSRSSASGCVGPRHDSRRFPSVRLQLAEWRAGRR